MHEFVYGLHACGLLSRSMELETKQYVYKTYCRPVFIIFKNNTVYEKNILFMDFTLYKKNPTW